MKTIDIQTEEQLRAMLQEQIDISGWGKTGTRSVKQLFEALQRREGAIARRDDGTVVYKLQTARAFIQRAEGDALMCGPKDLQGIDNSDLHHAGFPGGRIEGEEDPECTLRRELGEEMLLSHGEFRIEGYQRYEAPPYLRSFPNLPVDRIDHIFTVLLAAGHRYFQMREFECFDTVEGRPLLFRWMPETVWQARSGARRKLLDGDERVTYGSVIATLRIFGVDTSPWGMPGTGTLYKLFASVRSGRGAMVVGPSGIEFRISTARAYIRDGRGNVLVWGYEHYHGLENGELQMAQLPGGKILDDAVPKQMLMRDLCLKAGLLPHHDYKIANERLVRIPVIRSLPNLPGDQREYRFETTLRPGHPWFSRSLWKSEVNGKSRLFKWIPEEEWFEHENRSALALAQA